MKICRGLSYLNVEKIFKIGTFLQARIEISEFSALLTLPACFPDVKYQIIIVYDVESQNNFIYDFSSKILSLVMIIRKWIEALFYFYESRRMV